MFLSETICSIITKFWWNSHWMVLFQKWVERFGPLTKMPPITELSLTLNSMGNSHKILFLAWPPSWLKVGITGHNFGRGLSKDHSTKVWLELTLWFLKRRFLCEFPIEFNVKLSSVMGGILVKGPNRSTHFWKRTIPLGGPLPKLNPAFQTSDRDGHNSRT
jgi:hypothetical protein